MMDVYDAIVIGSGLGGLTAGALYARAGHRVLILERNADFGGAATTYRHGALTIEASLHETVDPNTPGDPVGRILRAIGILDDLEFVPLRDFYEVRGRLFTPPFTLPHGLAASEAALTSRFPAHRDGFRRFFEKIAAIQDAAALVGEQHDSLWWVLHAPTVPLKLWPLMRDLRLSLSDVFTELFDDDEAAKIALAANLGYYGDNPDTLWWLFYAIAQGGYLSHGGSYIRGGSGALSGRLVGAVEAEGGAALSSRPVTEILLDAHGRVAGVAHTARDGSDRREARAPVLFGNAAPAVLGDALPEAARKPFLARYEGRPSSISLFSISLGLNRPPRDLGVTHYATMLVPDWMETLSDYAENAGLMAHPPAGRMPTLGIADYNAIDSGLNPDGPYLVSIAGADRLSNWEGLDEATYRDRREAWLDAIIAEVDGRFPGFADAVVQREMATAATMHSYLNTPDGAIYGFAAEPPAGLRTLGVERSPKTAVPGLWLASSYGGFGGFTGTMLAGAQAAQGALATQRTAAANSTP